MTGLLEETIRNNVGKKNIAEHHPGGALTRTWKDIPEALTQQRALSL